jgi:integrase
MVNRDAVQAVAVTAALPQNVRRTDALEAAQLQGWFAGADALGNRTIATYLKALLLTGARREEMAALKWADVDFQWRKLTLSDKVQKTRTIPLSAYLAYLLTVLPRINQFVFASNSKSGHIAEPRAAHANVQLHAGISALTVHGLRRSFSLLGEAAGAPAGAIAQIMGHSPSGVAEGYRPRSVDALRPYLAQIEAHILATAGIEFDADAQSDILRAVS